MASAHYPFALFKTLVHPSAEAERGWRLMQTRVLISASPVEAVLCD